MPGTAIGDHSAQTATFPSAEMTQRWEYATVILTYSVRQKKGTSAADNEWAYKRDLYIRLPGADKADHRPVSDSEDESLSGPSALDVLNELGAEGWDLVSRETTNSVFGKAYGWFEASSPVATTWAFKRPID